MKAIDRLYQLPAVSGDEKEVRDYLKEQYQTLGMTIVQDRLGSIFAKKAGASSCTVMISSNLDEAGGIVSDLREDGTLEFVLVGPLEKAALTYQDVVVLDRRHRHFLGTVVPSGEKLLVDIGAYSKKELESYGIAIGDTIVLEHRTRYLQPHLVMSNNLQNKIGLVLGLELLNELKDEELPYQLCIGGIAQSVTGQRGAITATTTIQPDVALVVDASPVNDYQEGACYIRYFDKTLLPNRQLIDHLEQVAAKNGIRLIHEVQETGTDGAFIHKSLSGTPTVVLEIPLKQKTPFSNIVNMKDVARLKQLICLYLHELTSEDVACYHFERLVTYDESI
ncbi:hypothetical protein [Streptococcus respiraculi]|uniref:hypothetical protein n=1 Tax=Streptococcus respiraculi TaxID=2021971 RepID=UPI0013C41725|nr:hypothetical protein [Streptococcus respiraculi]